MNQLPQVTLTIRFVFAHDPDGRAPIKEIPGVYVDIGEQTTTQGYPKRSLEAVVVPSEENREDLLAFFDAMDTHRRLDGTLNLFLTHGGSYASDSFEVQVDSIRSLRNGPFLLHFTSIKPNPKKQRFYVRWFGAWVPARFWDRSEKKVAFNQEMEIA